MCHSLRRVFREGNELNPFVFTTLLKLLVSMDLAHLCWALHACVQKLGHYVDALIEAYSVRGNVDVALQVSDDIRCMDMVS